jgi:hypothetical protein
MYLFLHPANDIKNDAGRFSVMNDREIKKQIGKLGNEGENSAIVNDVINSEYEGYPSHLEKEISSEQLKELEEAVVRNSVDGKTWNSNRD